MYYPFRKNMLLRLLLRGLRRLLVQDVPDRPPLQELVLLRAIPQVRVQGRYVSQAGTYHR